MKVEARSRHLHLAQVQVSASFHGTCPSSALRSAQGEEFYASRKILLDL